MTTTSKIFNKKMIILGIAPGLLLYVVFGLLPSVFTFILSFTDITGMPGIKFLFVGLDNYMEALFRGNRRDTINSYIWTFKFAFVVTTIQILISLLLALILNSNTVKMKNFARAVIFSPIVLGITLVGLAWTLVLNPADGPAQKILELFGASSNFLSDWKHALDWVILIQIWNGIGFTMVIFLGGLQTISPDLYEAGYIDGTTSFQKFRYITLPLIWPQVTLNTMICIIGTLTNFATFLVTTGGGYNTGVLGIRIFATAFGGNNKISGVGETLRQGFAASQSVLMFFIVLLFTLGVQYLMSRKEQNT